MMEPYLPMQQKTSAWRVASLGVLVAFSLSACSPYIGVGVPVGPFSVGVGVGSGGVSAGVGTGVGPVGVGVGVNQSGQVTGNAGVGVGTSVGGANVGVGVGTGTVLYDPAMPAPVPCRSPHLPPPPAARCRGPGRRRPPAPSASPGRDRGPRGRRWRAARPGAAALRLGRGVMVAPAPFVGADHP